MHNVVALLNAPAHRLHGWRPDRSTSSFRWWDGFLVEQVLTKARTGIERVVERAHQHQHADALTALYHPRSTS